MPIYELCRAHPALLLVASLAGAGPLMVWRFRETQSPVSTRKILVPPLAMSTGLSMFLVPAARVPASWALASFLLGALVLAIPMSRTSRLTRCGDAILMQRSKAFLWILAGIVVLRFALRAIVERYLTPMQTGALFFLLAFGMIVRWRGAMFLEYRRLRSEVAAAEAEEVVAAE